MKITITYEFNADWHPMSYWARTGTMQAGGTSYEEAKQRLLEKLQLVSEVPPPEEVEI